LTFHDILLSKQGGVNISQSFIVKDATVKKRLTPKKYGVLVILVFFWANQAEKLILKKEDCSWKGPAWDRQKVLSKYFIPRQFALKTKLLSVHISP